MSADGTGVTRLTNDPAFDFNPAWAPDGTRIAFQSDRDGNEEIYIMNADGSRVTQLTANPLGNGGPAWSPDGSQIAFTSGRDGNSEIYVVNVDGSGLTNLTKNPASDSDLRWSPDGSKVVFASGRDSTDELYDLNPEIYTMNADGSAIERLTNNPAFDLHPDWQPLVDSDGDGCYDSAEVLTSAGSEMLGGRRSPKNFWDFFDTPDASNVRDKAIAGTDFFRLLQRFGSSGDTMIDPLSAPPPAPAYHTAFDRGPSSGPNAWNLTAADGSIAGTDFFAVLAQFGHSCA